MSIKLFKYLNENNKLPPKDILIVDLGCGDGRVLEPFYREGYKVVGIDLDKEAIEAAQHAMPNGSFGLCDIRQFVLPEKCFVIIRNVLSFLETKQQVQELLNKLQNNSTFFTFFGPNDEKSHTALFWEREEIEKICKNLGAEVIDETDEVGINLAGGPRRSHVFSCLK